MKNKPNPFVASNLVVEEQLQNIAAVVKVAEKATKESLFEVYSNIKYAIRAIDKQHAKTTTIVMAALVEYEPGVVDAFTGYEVNHQTLGVKMLEATESLLLSISPTEKATAVAALTHHYNKYSAAIHENAFREEATLLPLLKRYYNEEEIKLMQVQVEQALAEKRLKTLVPEPV